MREGTVEETSLADWDAQIAVNLTAPFLLTRHAMSLLRATKGAIVNVGSIEGLGTIHATRPTARPRQGCMG